MYFFRGRWEVLQALRSTPHPVEQFSIKEPVLLRTPWSKRTKMIGTSDAGHENGVVGAEIS